MRELAARALASGLIFGVERGDPGDDLVLYERRCDGGEDWCQVIGLSSAGRAWVEERFTGGTKDEWSAANPMAAEA